jgi:hypothetical protein
MTKWILKSYAAGIVTDYAGTRLKTGTDAQAPHAPAIGNV